MCRTYKWKKILIIPYSDTPDEAGCYKKSNYFFCDKDGHYKNECQFLKKEKAITLAVSLGAGDEKFITVISKINLFEDEMAWWIDYGVTFHVCKNKRFFKTRWMMELVCS